MDKDKKPPVAYVLLPKKLIITMLIMYLSLLGVIGGTVVWSNKQWCGIVILFNETYEENPPPTPIGQKLALEFKQMGKTFLCS